VVRYFGTVLFQTEKSVSRGVKASIFPTYGIAKDQYLLDVNGETKDLGMSALAAPISATNSGPSSGDSDYPLIRSSDSVDSGVYGSSYNVSVDFIAKTLEDESEQSCRSASVSGLSNQSRNVSNNNSLSGANLANELSQRENGKANDSGKTYIFTIEQVMTVWRSTACFTFSQ